MTYKIKKHNATIFLLLAITFLGWYFLLPLILNIL